MSRGFFKLVAGCALLLAPVASSRADLLHVLTSPGILQSIDPATGLVSRSVRLQLPGKVVSYAKGLGTAPNGITYGLVGIADDCSRDPSRTVFAGGSDGCTYVTGGKEACESAFVIAWDGPMPCTWSDGSGCDACGDCPNTCAAPPACEGSSRTQWLGFGSDSCRQLDGAAACGEGYYSDAGGARACFVSGGQCLACDVAAQVAGACIPECAAPVPCADASRDVFAGAFGCERLQGQPEVCMRAFESDSGVAASVCIANGDSCVPCTLSAEADGFCTNSCVPGLPCTGDPVRSRVPLCHTIMDADACAQAYTIEDGKPTSCFVNENQLCLPCTLQQQRAGACTEACIPPVCSNEPARTALLASPEACHAYDAAPVGCDTAFFVGRCGVSSCHYDAEAATCRPCTLDDPGRCENACGSFDALDPIHRPQLVAIDLASSTVTPLASPGDWFEQPAPDGAGNVYALGRYDTCAEPYGMFSLHASDHRPALLAPLAGPTVGALARHPDDGMLYRFGSDGLFVTDPATGFTTAIAIELPFFLQPRAMTWAAACNAFLVADDYNGLWILDPAARSLEQVGFAIPNLECDEGNCAVGLAVEGTSVCPPLDPPTFTTTTTTTSTSSSTSSTTLPSEQLTGKRLLMTNDIHKPKKRRLEIRSDDRAITLGGGAGSGDDPTLHGGRLRVVAASGTFAATYPLDDGWRIVRKAGRVKGYEYRGDSAIRRIALRPGRLDVRGQGADLVQPLLQDPSTVRVVLQLGGRRWCLAFGGTFGARTPAKLSARDAPAPPGCGEP